MGQYAFFTLHYLQSQNPDQWPIPPYSCIRTVHARRALVRKLMRPTDSIQPSEVDMCILFLLTRFPMPPPVFSMRYKEIKLLALAFLRSKFDYEDHFLPVATHWTNPIQDVTMYKFPLQHMPGPETLDQVWYTWMHCSDHIGATGIFSLGRILPTDVEVAGIASNSDTFSFYGRVSQKTEYSNLPVKCIIQQRIRAALFSEGTFRKLM